jgi:hypothetical protein
MAKNKQRNQFESNDNQARGGQQGQQARGGQNGQQQQGQQAQGQGTRKSGGQLQAQQDKGGPQDILSSIRPALEEARGYIEGSPVRAAAIGAVAGGLLMTLFSTEKGRSFVKMAYDYANPMVAKYAREFISQQAGNTVDSVLSQH